MITAEEFSRKYTRLRSAMAISDISEMMIEFTKLHVEAALKEASEKAYFRDSNGFVCTSEENKKSILNA